MRSMEGLLSVHVLIILQNHTILSWYDGRYVQLSSVVARIAGKIFPSKNLCCVYV